jgi:hypothetical protein
LILLRSVAAERESNLTSAAVAGAVAEQKLDLMLAVHCDELTAATSIARFHAEAFRLVAE